MLGFYHKDIMTSNPSLAWQAHSYEHQFNRKDCDLSLWQYYVIEDTTAVLSVKLTKNDSIATLDLLLCKWFYCDNSAFDSLTLTLPSPVLDTTLCFTFNFNGTKTIGAETAFAILTSIERQLEVFDAYPSPEGSFDIAQFGGHLEYNHSDSMYTLFTVDPDIYFSLETVIKVMSHL